MKEETMAKRYNKAYCDPITAFMDPHCSHKESVIYDAKFRKGGNHPYMVQGVCTNCGKISKWAKVHFPDNGKDAPWWTIEFK